MKFEYQTLNDAIRLIETMSNGQGKVIGFEVENEWWVFYLNTNVRSSQIKIRLLAI